MINNGKAKIDNTFGQLSILIPSKKNWFALIFGTVWLGGWYFGFTSASSALLTGNSGASGFTTVWLAGWTIGGLLIISILLWGYFGKEKFSVVNGELSFDKTIFGIGPKKKMDASHIKNIRTEFINGNASDKNGWGFWGMGPGKIKFDYGLKTFSFGLGVDDAEASYLVDLMKKHFKL